MIVTSWWGGAHCCYIHYIFELEPKLRLLATIEDGDTDLAHFEKLNQDRGYYYRMRFPAPTPQQWKAALKDVDDALKDGGDTRGSLWRLRTALFPVIGRATCSLAAKTVISQPWWNVIRVSPCW